MSDSLRPHEPQHSRLPCPSPTPRVHPHPCPLTVMPPNHLILCRPLILLPSIFHSIRVFSSEPVLPIRWPKYWSFSFSISPSNEYSGLISFRMDWLDLLAVQGTLKSLLQHHSSKALILWCSIFFIVQLTSIHDYWKNHSFDYMDLDWQSNVSAFQYAVLVCQVCHKASLIAQLVRNQPAVQETCLIPGSGRNTGEVIGYPLQYSGLENSMGCIVHGVAKSWT